MFIMDVPAVPPQQAPIVLAHAADTGSVTAQPDYLLKTCKETESAGDPKSAFRAIDPAGMLKVYIQNRDNRPVRVETITNVTMLQNTAQGNITSVVDNTGRSWYRYDAIPDYVGNDQAIFMAEFEGKRYKIVLEIHVLIVIDDHSPTCPPPQLIKINGKPVSGSNGYNSVYDLSSVTVTFADLPDGAARVGRNNQRALRRM